MKAQSYKRFKYVPYLVLLVGVLVSLGLFHELRESERATVRESFQKDAEKHVTNLASNINRRILQIRSVANLFSSSDWVSEREFINFSTQVYDGFNSERRLSWVDIVDAGDVDKVIEKYRENSGLDFQDFDFFDYENGERKPLSPDHDKIIAWTYTIPKVPNDDTVHGRNITANLPIYQNLTFSLENKELFLSLFRPPLAPLVSPYVMIVAPVIKKHGDEEPELDGLIISGNILKSIFEDSLLGATDSYNYFMKDDAGTIYSYQNDAIYQTEEGLNLTSARTYRQKITIANRGLEIIIRLRQATIENISMMVYLLPFLTVLLSCLVSYISYIMLRQQRMLAIEVRHKTKELSEKVREIQHVNNSLEQAKVQAEAASIAKSNFLSTMSHELRTPLTSVLGFLDLLHDGNVSETEKKYIETARFSSVVLLDLINDILDFSRLDSGQMKPMKKVFNLTKLVEDIVASLKPQADKKRLSLTIKSDKKTPYFLNQDVKFLRQVLLNIISNAIKYTHQGSVTIGISADDETCFIDIIDTGVGIAHEDQANLFTKFERFGDQNQPGTGLGLAIAEKLISLMDGDIVVYSQIGVGSKFTLKLPYDASLKQIDMIDKIDVSEDGDSEAIKGMTVLIVDDNDINRMVISAALKKWDVNYIECSSGQEAIDFMKSNKSVLIDIIFMDINMPEMTGLEAMQNIRNLTTDFKALPIYAVTANSDIADVEVYIKSGFTGYIAKPLDMQLLKSCLTVHSKNNA